MISYRRKGKYKRASHAGESYLVFVVEDVEVVRCTLIDRDLLLIHESTTYFTTATTRNSKREKNKGLDEACARGVNKTVKRRLCKNIQQQAH